MDSYLDKVDAPKIEDVYEARLTELANWRKEAKSNYAKNLEIRSKNKSASEIAIIKKQLQEKLKKDMERFDKSTEHCKLQMRNKNFIGGNYDKSTLDQPAPVKASSSSSSSKNTATISI